MPKIDCLSGRKDESLNGLVRPVHEIIKSLTITSNKMCELLIYNKAINDPIHRNNWKNIINKEL